MTPNWRSRDDQPKVTATVNGLRCKVEFNEKSFVWVLSVQGIASSQKEAMERIEKLLKEE